MPGTGVGGGGLPQGIGAEMEMGQSVGTLVYREVLGVLETTKLGPDLVCPV